MKLQPTRTKPAKSLWPRKIRLGRVTVTIYRRTAPSGDVCFMVGNYSSGKRRFDCYGDEAAAIEAASRLARQLSEREVVAAAMTNEQAADYAAAVQALAPFKVALPVAAGTLAECLKFVADLPNVLAACQHYAASRKTTTRKPVADVVAELLAVKANRQASKRYLEDLRSRLNRFADAFRKDACDVTTPEVQAWLDGFNLAAQTYANFKRCAHLLFEFAVARGYAAANPVAGCESRKTPGTKTAVYSPTEMLALLRAASPVFLPCLAIGAFAGLRSAEIERLQWSDLDLAAGHIVVGADRAKTATRRVVPLAANLAALLAPYAGQTGSVWQGTHEDFYAAQQTTAAAAGLPWKANALRHSFASYRFAQTGDAGRVAGECGNSAAVVHKHYRELVKPADAAKWFALKPATPANVVAMPTAAAA